jgi:protein-L-isoaspartate(D-aspartate) O-methyltransferase
LKDTNKHQGLRNQLANLLEEKGITDKKVLEAIKKIPRHLFLNSSFEDFAYQDKAFPIGADQTISQPYTVAFQSIRNRNRKRLSDSCFVFAWRNCL